MTDFWQDKERRRAILLSLLIHVAAILALVWFAVTPRPVPLDPFIVIDVGSPAFSETQADAATVDTAAPEASVPQVDAERVGRPSAQPAPAPAPLPDPVEEQAQAEPEPELEPASGPEAQAQPEPEAEPEPAPERAEAEPPPSETVAEQPRPAPPAPVAPPPVPSAQSLPGAPAAALPEIEEEVLPPRPLADSIPVPRPTVTAQLPDARVIAPQPRSEVAAAQEIPRPSVSSAVPAEQPLPTPRVTATVPDAQSVPTPSVRADVAAPSPVPTPSVRADVATPNPVPTPSVRADVATPNPVPRPSVRADVSAPRPVPTPSPSAAVASARAVPSPAATADVAEARPIQRPNAAAQVQPQEPRATAAQSTSDDVLPLPLEPSASSNRPSGDGAADIEEVPPGVPAPRSNRTDAGPTGGNAARAGQRSPPEEGEGLGAAAGPTGERGTGVPARPEPYSAFRRSPVAVLIDNANGYPQSGLLEAAVIVEMPVEGGITRLMPIYDNTDPGAVGPVRSARDYFVRVSESYDSVLVHDGGSPAALQMIAQSTAPTLNAYSRGELFARAGERSAPYNLYSAGESLRGAVNRLRSGGMRPVSGTIFRPPDTAREVGEVTVPYGAAYRSGFAFQSTLGSYRWVRNGTPAVDAAGEQVRADAVLVGSIQARPYPDDPAGRLYIPLEGGSATLYLRGRAVEGTWFLEDGIRFQDGDGNLIDLRPFKTWMAFTPTYDARIER